MADAKFIKCTFVPQVWVNNSAIEADPLGETTWLVSLEEMETLTEHSSPESLNDDPYARDNLRFSPKAPEWVVD